jgi:hypothetical protein
VRVELPVDWEMLQFTRRPEQGRCAFADRYQFRLELAWRAVDGPPDMGRVVSDYVARLRADDDASDVRRLSDAPWPGLAATVERTATSRFGRHLPGEAILVEAVFLWPEGRDRTLERVVLDSIAEVPRRDDGTRRWRAFGLDLLATDGLPLTECQVEPARARLTFADERGRRRETFQRLGLVEEWLDRSVEDWLAAQMPRRGTVKSQSAVTVHGHEVALLAGTRPIRRLGGLINRPAPCDAAAWRCPNDGRLYCGSLVGRSAGSGTRLAGGRLACCPELPLPS